MSSDAAPRVAGRYERVLVRDPGSSHPTWLGRDTVLQRSVVLQQLVVAPEHLAQALREARALTAVDHPNLVAVHDVVADEDPPLVVLELVDGPTLTALVREHGRRSPREVALVGSQVAAALAAVHRAGLVHGGVGPSSVVMGPGDEAKLAPPATPEHGLAGESGRSADVWALGRTLDAVLAVRPDTAGAIGPVLAAMVADDFHSRITAAEASARLAEVAQEAPAPVVGFGLFPWDDGEDVAATRPVRAAREGRHPRAASAGGGAVEPAAVAGGALQTAGADGGPPGSGSTATGRDRGRRRGGLLLVGVAGAALLVVGAALAFTGREDSAVPDGAPTSTTTISTSTSTTRTGTPTTATSTASPTSTTTAPQPTTPPPAAPPPPPATTRAPAPTTTTSTTSSSTSSTTSSSTTPSMTTSTSSTTPAFTPSPTSEPSTPPTTPTSEPSTTSVPTTPPAPTTAPTQTSAPSSSLAPSVDGP